MTTSGNIGSAMPAGLQALIGRANRSGKAAPPVERWNPPFCGDLDMRIARDGTWHYLGSPIGRKALVNLFASVLRRDDDGKYYLVTPVEKIGITVDDAPFLAVEMATEGAGRDQVITLRTNLGNLVRIGEEHPLRFEIEPDTGGLKPYVRVRGRLDALFTRALMYQLADHMQERADEDGESMGVWSGGHYFRLDPAFLAGMAGD